MSKQPTTNDLRPTTYDLRLVTVFLVSFVVLSLVVGHAVSAQDVGPDPSEGGLVKCGRDIDDETGALVNPCGFDDLVATANLLVSWLVYIAVFVAVAMFTYAGYLYVASGGSEEQVKKAHEIFRNVFIGFILVLAAWLIVYTISVAVLDDTSILLLDT